MYDIAPTVTTSGAAKSRRLHGPRIAPAMRSTVMAKFEVGQCFLVEACRQTEWGLRCRVPVGDGGKKGYVIKYFSDNTGDYIVFRNQCR